MLFKGYVNTRKVFFELHPDESQPSWGYHGSGLALALLIACDVTRENAIKFHQQFKCDVIAK